MEFRSEKGKGFPRDGKEISIRDFEKIPIFTELKDNAFNGV